MRVNSSPLMTTTQRLSNRWRRDEFRSSLSRQSAHQRRGAADRSEYRQAAGAPLLYGEFPFAQDGGLISYGVDRIDQFKRAASYVDRILKGERPADLPIQQPTKFQFVINLKTAKTLGLELPLTLQMTADEVIQ
jgi:ABC-type uncharacterized transport system substrate-binding protein